MKKLQLMMLWVEKKLTTNDRVENAEAKAKYMMDSSQTKQKGVDPTSNNPNNVYDSRQPSAPPEKNGQIKTGKKSCSGLFIIYVIMKK